MDTAKPIGYLYLDTETTGLDPRKDRIYEIAWKLELMRRDGSSLIVHTHQAWVAHDVPWDNVCEYTQQSPNYELWRNSKHQNIQDVLRKLSGIVSTYYADTSVGTISPFKVFMVAANPSFDHSMLVNAGPDIRGLAHRKIDIESYAMAKLGMQYPPSLTEICEYALGPGYTQTHGAVQDVEDMYKAFTILRR